MPRQKRLDIPGQVYHIISRGIERRKIFRDYKDREEFIRRLSKGIEETGIHCFAWVLMSNHFHLLVRPLKQPVSNLMRKVLTGYVTYFNGRHRRVGHLFQNRYKAILCQEDEYFKKLVSYIHLNPVRAKMIKTPSELARYPWSGHAYILEKRVNDWQNVNEVLGYFGSRKQEAIKRYVHYLKQGWHLGYLKEMVGGGLYRSAGEAYGVNLSRKYGENTQHDSRILGDGNFVGKMLKESHEEWEKKTKLLADGWNLERLIKKVTKEFNLKKGELQSGRRFRHLSLAKGVVSYFGSEQLGLSLEEIANQLRISRQAVFLLKEKGEGYAKQNHNFIT